MLEKFLWTRATPHSHVRHPNHWIVKASSNQD